MRTAIVVAVVLACSAVLAATPQEEADQLFQAKAYARAAAAYRAIVAADPKNVQATYRLATSLHLAGQPKDAIPRYERALALGLDTPGLHYNLACALAMTGRRDQALTRLEEAVASGHDDGDAIERDDDLKSLRGQARFTALVAAARRNRAPCRSGDEFRQLDFWIGAWDVHDPTGQKIGESRVEPILGDCVILESWTNARGRQGKSFNIYDATTKRWRQTWVDDSGGLHEYTGGREGAALVYRRAWTGRDGKPLDVRMTFRPLGGGRVQQLIEQTGDGGKTWTTTFDGTYVPRK